MNIAKYKTLVFDCDGVILNSNQTKTDAFYQAALPYGEKAAQALVDYHVGKGGVSRYIKFSYFLKNIIEPDTQGPNMDSLLDRYAGAVRKGLMTCDIAKGLEQLREVSNQARWLIISGGDQEELRDVFRCRGIDKYFDGGIFGSPDTKEDILAREKSNGNILQPALFFGDSKYDYEASTRAGLDFVFLSGWSEWEEGVEWMSVNNISLHESLWDCLSVEK